MDDDVGDEQEPAPVGRWKATSSYDIYMVDTPKDGDGDGTVGDDAPKKQPKRRRQQRRSKSRQSKNGDSGTGDNTTPDSAEEHPPQQDSAQEDGEASPHERAADREVEDDNYTPPSEDEASLDDDEFVIPSDPAEQERFKCRLLATASSLKKKQQHLRADQDLLADKWTEVLAAEEYELKPCPDAAQLRHGKMCQTCETYWRIRQDKQDRSTDRMGAPRFETVTVMPDTNLAGPNTVDKAHRSYVVI